jgi:hypothetical protein
MYVDSQRLNPCKRICNSRELIDVSARKFLSRKLKPVRGSIYPCQLNATVYHGWISPSDDKWSSSRHWSPSSTCSTLITININPSTVTRRKHRLQAWHTWFMMWTCESQRYWIQPGVLCDLRRSIRQCFFLIWSRYCWWRLQTDYSDVDDISRPLIPHKYPNLGHIKNKNKAEIRQPTEVTFWERNLKVKHH